MTVKRFSDRINLGGELSLDILPSIENNTIRLFYTVYYAGNEIIRNTVEGIDIRDLVYVVYSDLFKKGFDIHYIKEDDYIKDELIPHIASMEYVDFLYDRYPTNRDTLAHYLTCNT